MGVFLLHPAEESGAVESVKAASDVYSPAEGTVTEVNDKLENTPSLINKAPYEDGACTVTHGSRCSTQAGCSASR